MTGLHNELEGLGYVRTHQLREVDKLSFALGARQLADFEQSDQLIGVYPACGRLRCGWCKGRRSRRPMR
jgi:hypothetical protein